MYKNLHQIQQDPLFRKKLIMKFLNQLFYNGKKFTAEKLLYSFFFTMKQSGSGKFDPCNFLICVFDRLRLSLETKNVPVGGTSYTVSFPHHPSHQQSSLYRKFIKIARGKVVYKHLNTKLLTELLALSEGNSPMYQEATAVLDEAMGDAGTQHYRWY